MNLDKLRLGGAITRHHTMVVFSIARRSSKASCIERHYHHRVPLLHRAHHGIAIMIQADGDYYCDEAKFRPGPGFTNVRGSELAARESTPAPSLRIMIAGH